MIKKTLVILISLILLAPCSSGKSKLDLGWFLKELTTADFMAEYPSIPYKAAQVSSYDRASKSPDAPGWFANSDGFGIERIDTVSGRVEKVLFEQDGPGVITRFWLTTRSPKGTMRFYFDGETEPGWVIPSFDLTETGIPDLGGLVIPHTSYSKGVSGGSTLFLPIPFAKSCKVTFEEPEGWEGVPRYYQINYRSYPEGTSIESFGIESVKKNLARIKRAGKEINAMPNPGRNKAQASRTIYGDDAKVHLSLDASRGGSAVRRLSFNISAADSSKVGRIMDNLIVKMYFDGILCVDVPLSFLGGAGLEGPEVTSRYLNCNGNGQVEIAFPMPFREKAEISIVNYGEEQALVSMEASSSPYRFTDNTLYFKAVFKEARGLSMSNVPEENYDWNFTCIRGGRGIYVADVLSMFNHSRAWYGEGDEKIFVDGESFPSHFGTGTEDYYNSSWAPVVPFHTAFGGAPRADLPSSAGYNTFYRARGLDVIPFEESLRFDLEMISWMRGKIDYFNTVFFYGSGETVADTATRLPFAFDYPSNPLDPSEYRIAGSFEFEDKKPSGKSNTLQTDVQPMAMFPDGVWSRGKQIICTGGHPGDWLEYEFKTGESGRFDLHLFITRAGDYGVCRVSAGGKTKVFDAFGYGVTNGEVILEDIDIDGNLKIRMDIIGKNPLSSGYIIGLDCITINNNH